MSQSDAERLRAAAERSRTGRSTSRRGASRAQVEAAKARITLPSQRRAQEQAEESGGGGKSLLQQIPGTIFNAGRGLFTGLVPAAVDSTVGNVGAVATSLYNRASGDDISAQDVRENFGPIGRALINENTLESVNRGDSFAKQFDNAAPILTEPVKSFGRTAQNVAELGEVAFTDKGFGESSLAKASDESQTADWLLENVGNILFAGRLASGAASGAAARAGRSAPRLQRVAEVTRKADDALDRALLAPITLPAKGAAAGVRAAANSAPGQRLANSGLGQELAKRQLTPGMRGVRDLQAKYDTINAIRREDEAVSPAKRVQTILAGIDDEGLSRRQVRKARRDPETVAAAEGAMFLQLEDAAPIFGPLRPLREASPDAFGAAVAKRAEMFGNDTITPAAVGMFLDKLDGSLDPSLAADIDLAGREWVRRANDGGLVREIDGTEVVTGSTPNEIAGTGRMVDTPEGPAQRAEAITARERIFDNVDAEDLTSAPARFREPIALGRQMRQVLDELDGSEFPLPEGMLDQIKGEILTTVDRGLAELDPAFVRGGPTPSGGGPGGRGAPKATKISSQYVKGGGNAPLQVDAQAALAANDIRRQATNEMLKEMQETYGVRPSQFPDLEGLSGRDLVDAISERTGKEMVPWDPRKVYERSDDPTRTRDSIRTSASEVNAESVLVPKVVADAMDYAFREDNKFAQIVIDKPTRLFKASVLALSGRWMLGNAISGTIMLHGGKVSVADIIRLNKRARDGLRAYAEGRQSEIPREILGTGATASERRLFDQFANSLDNIDFDEMTVTRTKNPVGRAVGGAVRKGYDLNTWTDDFYRSIAYLKKVEDGMSEGRAVKEALDIMGNYDKLTPFERRVVRRVFPFWSWTKHITKLSAKLATEDPARVTWNLHLPTVFNDSMTPEGPDFLQGMAEVGEDEFVSLSWLFPFATNAEIDPANPLEFVGSSINPVLGTATALATGIDPAFGRFSPLSRPDAPYGQNPGSPIFTNPSSVPFLIGRNLPQFQGVYDEVQRRRSGGVPTRLFGTGERRQGVEDPNKNLDDNLARVFGIPIPKTYTSR